MRLVFPLLIQLAACFGAANPPDPPQPTPASAPEEARAWPDVIVITLDTTRADHLGAYGYFRDTSPTFDALAAKALQFDRLVVPMATTLPTHTSLFTGVWPTEHGVVANLQHGGERFLPSESLVPVAAHLQGHGYQTGAFVSAAPLERKAGLASGFDVYDQPSKVERSGDLTVDAAIGWLAEAGPAPLLLWVHLYDPHNPFAPPKEYAERFVGKDHDEVDAWLDARGVSKTAKRPTGITVRAKRAHNLYDAEIRFMDDQLARLVAAIERRGRAEESLWIVAGDHGEGMNQHGQPGHGLVWQEQLHAPLLLRAPGHAHKRIPTTLSMADVLPTAFGLVDLPEEGAISGQFSGMDVLDSGAEERPVLSQTSSRQLMFGRPMTYAWTGPRWKCQWADGQDPVLYDLIEDPYELTPVHQSAERARCMEGLKAELTRQRERAVALGAGETAPMDAEQVERLKALGYLDDDATHAPESPKEGQE